jgi:hypothetical protein
VGSGVELPVPDERHTVVRTLVAIGIASVVLVSCSATRHASAHGPTASRSTSTSTTVAGRVVTVPTSFRGGLMQLDPSAGATASVSAVQAEATAGNPSINGEHPTALLGRLTVKDYGRGSVLFIDHRLVWFVLYHRYPMTCRGPKACPGLLGTRAVPVDARTGKSLGEWGWSGEN